MSDQKWIVEAKKHIGTKEIKGSSHNKKIIGWWSAIRRGGIKNDETPWCAAFVGACLEVTGIRSTRFESAKSYLEWGIRLKEPIPGCIVVFSRDGGGHVGFVVGKDAIGNLLVLGGNQGDEVKISAFSVLRVSGYRWPDSEPVPTDVKLTNGVAKLSSSEA